MEKKEKKMHKIHLKDYTNQLEKILEKKNFSLQTKNLLLSMFYKIENAYPDYHKTKEDVYDKGDFLERLLSIIEDKCSEIEIGNTYLIEDEEPKKAKKTEKNEQGYIIDKQNKKITILGNEFTALNAILEMDEESICLPEEETVLQEAIDYFLNLGQRMNEAEIIRDFNGWSWDIILKDIKNIRLNLAFQNFIYLLGYNFIVQWIENDSNLADYLSLAHEKLKEEFGQEKADRLIRLLCRISIEMVTEQNEEQRDKWENLKKETNKELEKLNDKKNFLEEVTEEKKKITKKIQKIDKIVNNTDALAKEYEQRNAKLPNKEKIFSIRHLVNKLEIERQEYVDEMKKYNILIDPKGYIDRKDKISKNAEFLNELNLVGKKQENANVLIELCLLFLSCFQIKIAKAQTRQEIMSYFHILRYYHLLIFNQEGIVLKEIEKLKQPFNKTIELLLVKAKKMYVIDEVTDNEEINLKILSSIFESKMIDLNHLIIETKVEDGKLIVECYDTNILENSFEVQSNQTVKLKKKTKLFI